MEQDEMIMAYAKLYNKIVHSNDDKAMHILGRTIKAMVEELISCKPETAREYLETLEAVNWNNYLTKKEAINIVSNMSPEPMWNSDAWQQAMTEMDIPTEEIPYYNDYALYVVMNQVVSDHGRTIARIKGLESVKEMEPSELAKYAYELAIDLLKDKDMMYNVREYFLK